MSHIIAIGQLISSCLKNTKRHAIIIDGPPGWGKTTTVERSLEDRLIKAAYLGSYATPLHLYNFLYENIDSVVVIDDCAGLFVDTASMAILKAATYSARGGERLVKWGSTSTKALVPEFSFNGKFIMICNSFPNTADGDAIRSRSFLWPIQISPDEGRQLLLEASRDKKWFDDPKTAKEVAAFLGAYLTEESVWQISFRLLENAYDLALDHPNSWRDLILPQLPKKKVDPEQLVRKRSISSVCERRFKELK
jgi:hypothetical protein